MGWGRVGEGVDDEGGGLVNLGVGLDGGEAGARGCEDDFAVGLEVGRPVDNSAPFAATFRTLKKDGLENSTAPLFHASSHRPLPSPPTYFSRKITHLCSRRRVRHDLTRCKTS